MSFENLKKDKLKVGIVGAGPSGSMAAYLLALDGHDITLLERREKVERKVCGEYLCPLGVQLLDELNVLEKLCHGFLDLNGMVIVSPSGIVVPSYFPSLKNAKTAKGLALNRKVFDQKLIDLALDHGAKLLAGKTVTEISQTTEGKWVVGGNFETCEFDLLIAADGRQSKIGHKLGHLRKLNTKRIALHCFLSRKIDRGQRLGEMHIFNDNLYCGIDPINDDEVNVSVVCESTLLKNEDAVSIINKTIEGSNRLSALFNPLDDIKGKEVKLVTCLSNKNYFLAGNNLAYVGDAAGFIDPLTGEGIYNALLSSRLLVESILQFPDLNSALSNYKRKKNLLSLQKNVLNHFFQFLIKAPFLVNLIATILKKSPKRADHFIGIIGNVYDPITGLIKMLKR